MGVDISYYTGFGHMFRKSTGDITTESPYGDYEEIPDSIYEWEEDSIARVTKSDLEVIPDCMSGDYVFVGKILFRGGNLRWGEVEDVFAGIDITGLSVEDMEDHIRNEFINPLGSDIHAKPFVPKIYTWAHYS